MNFNYEGEQKNEQKKKLIKQMNKQNWKKKEVLENWN